MSFEIVLVLTILAGAVACFATERLPVDLVALLVLSALLVSGILTPEHTADPAVLELLRSAEVTSAGCAVRTFWVVESTPRAHSAPYKGSPAGYRPPLPVAGRAMGEGTGVRFRDGGRGERRA